MSLLDTLKKAKVENQAMDASAQEESFGAGYATLKRAIVTPVKILEFGLIKFAKGSMGLHLKIEFKDGTTTITQTLTEYFATAEGLAFSEKEGVRRPTAGFLLGDKIVRTASKGAKGIFDLPTKDRKVKSFGKDTNCETFAMFIDKVIPMALVPTRDNRMAKDGKGNYTIRKQEEQWSINIKEVFAKDGATYKEIKDKATAGVWRDKFISTWEERDPKFVDRYKTVDDVTSSSMDGDDEMDDGDYEEEI